MGRAHFRYFTLVSLQPGQAVVCGGIEHLGSPCRRKQSLRRGMGRGEGRVMREENSPSAEAVARCWPVESNAMSRISSSCPLWRE